MKRYRRWGFCLLNRCSKVLYYIAIFYNLFLRGEVSESSVFQVFGNERVRRYYQTDSELASKSQPRRVNPYPNLKRIDFGHIEANGIYYPEGYSKCSLLFGPEYKIGSFLPLVEFRGVAVNNGKLAGNVGFIGRFLPKSFCEVLGFNLFYDVRQGRKGNFQQVGGGFEVLSKRWEMHTNAYVPVGRRQHTKRFVFDDYIGDFKAVLRMNEFAEYAVDANAGYYLVQSKNFQFYVSAGLYYFFGKYDTSALGGRLALRPQITDYLSFEFSISHDRIFETILQANIVFTLPLYNYSSAIKRKRGPCGVLNRQIYQPIDRDIILRRKNCWNANF